MRRDGGRTSTSGRYAGTEKTKMKVVACRPALVRVVFGIATAIGSAHAQDTAATDLAAQLRIQGYACNQPVTVERDATRSRPDEQVWLVRCGERTYRVRLVPDMAARVEQLN
jgi:hypothetical protein